MKKYYFVNSISEEDHSFEVQEVGMTVKQKVYGNGEMFRRVKIQLADAESEGEPLIIELDLEKGED